MTINKLALKFAILFAFMVFAAPTKFAVEDVRQRFYQSQGFILSEQLTLTDESSLYDPGEAAEDATRIFPDGGLMLDAQGAPLNVYWAVFVLNADGHLFSGHNIPGVHHSYLYQSNGVGKDVAMAGHMSVKDGKVVLISNQSGHYQPNRDQLIIAVQYLDKLGVLDKMATISFADEFITENLSIDEIRQTDVQALLDRYPGPSKKADSYMEERRLADQAFNKKVEELRPLCPDLKNHTIREMVPDFKLPKAVQRIDKGTIQLGSKYWQIFIDQSWPDLPEEVLQAPLENFQFMEYVNPYNFTQTTPSGLVTRIGGCHYSLLHKPYPQKVFAFWLVPLAE